MTASAITPTSERLAVADTWRIGVEVREDASPYNLIDATVVVTVTKPDGTTATPAVTTDTTGQYWASHVLATAGRYTAVANVSGTVVSVVLFAATAEGVSGPPVLSDVLTYLGDEVVSAWGDDAIADALAAEEDAQAQVCFIEAAFPDDLAEALKRRVARNLAMRPLPLGLQTSMSEAAVATIRIGSDSEIARLERPHLRYGGLA